MGFFQKKHNEELFSLLESASEASENLFSVRPFDASPAPDALTPEEVLMSGAAASSERNNAANALESLKKRMLNASVSDREDNIISKPKKADNTERSDEPTEIKLNELSSYAEGKTVTEEVKPPEKTLLEKCRPFILDENGKASAMETAPTYKLESVAEILSSESKKTLDMLSEKYDISFDDLGKYTDKKSTEAKKEIKSEPYAEKEVFEDKMPKAQKAENAGAYFISDIDISSSKTSDEKSYSVSDGATIKFTPVSDSDISSRISISSVTRAIDLTGELSQLESEEAEELDGELRLEQTEFEEYVPDEEFEEPKQAKHFLRLLSLKKRRSFIVAFFSVVLTLLIALADMPFITGLILKNTKLCMTVCTVLYGMILLFNIDIFGSVKRIFSRHASTDILAVTSSVSVLAYAVTGILKNEIILNILLLGSAVLSIRAICRFFKASYMLLSFKQISSASPKRAVKLISDPAVTFAMAKGSIDGDVLAAAPQRTEHVDGFMKYSGFGVALGGKLPVIICVSALLSVVLGLACASYFDGIIYGFYSAAAVLCFAAMPISFLTEALPLYSASRRLSKLGAMLAGKTGAEHMEKANAVVLSAEDLFPSGTVTLHKMQVLSDNVIDDTIRRAASVTDSLSSPLASVFKKIAGSGGDFTLPASDTVKYEDKMGISGWVDNKFLFVGNRTLLEAHGIEVPNVEIDKKLLRQGYFPIYVATDNKACALLAVQYNVKPEIARELRKTSALGITMLINSSDPNLTEEMICDYFGLYDDSVKVMSAAGCHMYKNAVTFTDKCFAPAAYKGNPIGLAAIINSANRIKKSEILLTVLYALTSIFGTVIFTYMSFNGSGSPASSLTVLLYELICTAVSYILYLIKKP